MSCKDRRGLTLLVIVLAAGGVSQVSAQITYNVFPVVPASTRLAEQPTNPIPPITVSVRDSTLAYVVQSIAHQAHLRVAYNGSNPLFDKRISLQVTGATVMDAFAVALRGTDLTAKLASDGETMVINARSDLASDGRHRVMGGVVEGHVTDSASGAGLGGASVRVEGEKKLSTVTSDSGHFTLRDVPPGDQVLSVRLFGYKPAERTVTVVDSQRTAIHIVMVSVPTVLSGVVTTATGLQQRIAVGNDITTLNVDSIMQVAPIQTLTDLLETRVPGLTVLHSSGTPGDPSRLRLRGAGSIQGNNDPVLIVDGIRVYASQSDPRNNNLAPTEKMILSNRMLMSTISLVVFPLPRRWIKLIRRASRPSRY